MESKKVILIAGPYDRKLQIASKLRPILPPNYDVRVCFLRRNHSEFANVDYLVYCIPNLVRFREAEIEIRKACEEFAGIPSLFIVNSQLSCPAGLDLFSKMPCNFHFGPVEIFNIDVIVQRVMGELRFQFNLSESSTETPVDVMPPIEDISTETPVDVMPPIEMPVNVKPPIEDIPTETPVDVTNFQSSVEIRKELKLHRDECLRQLCAANHSFMVNAKRETVGDQILIHKVMESHCRSVSKLINSTRLACITLKANEKEN